MSWWSWGRHFWAHSEDPGSWLPIPAHDALGPDPLPFVDLVRILMLQAANAVCLGTLNCSWTLYQQREGGQVTATLTRKTGAKRLPEGSGANRSPSSEGNAWGSGLMCVRRSDFPLSVVLMQETFPSLRSTPPCNTAQSLAWKRGLKCLEAPHSSSTHLGNSKILNTSPFLPPPLSLSHSKYPPLTK